MGQPEIDEREKLIQLVDRIQKARGCVTDLDSLITQFEKRVPNPSASRLIFDPPSGRRMTAEQIVAAAFNSAD